MRVLGIKVGEALVDQWRGWLMPGVQPFRVPKTFAKERGWPDVRSRLPLEVLDAFELYGTKPDQVIVELPRSDARELPQQFRASQPSPHRWPTASAVKDTARTLAYVERGRRSSRHEDLGSHWKAIESQLPGARGIAGTFADRSGPNCFGAVMAAAGVVGAETEWMQVEPFEDWLAVSAKRGGSDDEPGTVLVWRTSDGSASHAAVTLGCGWLLHKPSQGWMSPTKVLTVLDGKLSARYPGQRLARYTLL